jgi:hypothetical protein
MGWISACIGEKRNAYTIFVMPRNVILLADFCFRLYSKSHLLLRGFILLLTGAYSGEIRNYLLRVLSLTGSRLATGDRNTDLVNTSAERCKVLSATNIHIANFWDVTTSYQQDTSAVAEHKIKGGAQCIQFQNTRVLVTRFRGQSVHN